MLDVITDFWKPVKKTAAAEKPDLDKLQPGSALSFGTVPQALVSGKRFVVSGVNTYQFGDERMTSFVLSNDREESVSLIVASAEGEQYLAISRRVAFADRMRMFDPAELEAVAEQPEATRLNCREIDVNWKHWVVSAYRKEISGLRGAVLKGDFRGRALPANVLSQPFDYMLLTSDNNEYAIEIERYADGRLEIHATIYRRVTDIVELENPSAAEARPASPPVLEVVKSESPSLASTLASAAPIPEKPIPEKPAPEKDAAPQEAPKAEEKPAAAVPPRPTPFKPAAEAAVITPPPPAPPLPHPAKEPARDALKETPKEEAAKPAVVPPAAPSLPPQPPMETKPMQMSQPAMQSNGSANPNAYKKQEMPAVNTHTAEPENEAIECDLRVANKIIEEAIRTEMRLSDVVRRIIALPVAYPESVQIPITLTDADFQLLAIRYGIAAADRNAIKTRIIEEINDFSGNGKK